MSQNAKKGPPVPTKAPEGSFQRDKRPAEDIPTDLPTSSPKRHASEANGPALRQLVADTKELDPNRPRHVSLLYGDITEADGYVRAVVTPDNNGVYAPYTTRGDGTLVREVLTRFPVSTGVVTVVVKTIHTPYPGKK